jgi:uncharacterized damage-inducible protein DinB
MTSASPRDSENVFGADFLVEFEVAERQLLALARAIPAERYTWRPNETARSVSEVFVHISAGNFYLLSVLGQYPPRDIYGEISGEGEQALWQIVRRNDELEKTVQAKERVMELARESFQAVRAALSTHEKQFSKQSIRRKIYMRLLVHTHEHMGQLIAYTRSIGLPVPWEDWRPDRRASSQEG